MVESVIWLPNAQDTFYDALNYLLNNFSEKDAEIFSEKATEKLRSVRLNPYVGRPSKLVKGIYKFNIHKRVDLIYRYKPRKKQLIIMRFWNTLQNPGRMRF
jgi:plasmid stabilization system protein ParE